MLWHSYNGAERAALEETAATWNAAHPDTPLVLVAVPHDAFADKISSAVPRGNGPDLFIYAQDRVGDWADSGVIEPIEFWVDDARADRFGAQTLGLMAYRGSLWGMPLALKSLALFYRTDLVAQPPRTTDDFTLRKNPYAVAFANPDLYAFAPWLHGFGGRVLDDDGKVALASPEAARALDFARSLIERDLAPRNAENSSIASMFNDGKVATAIQGPWFIPDIAPNVPWKVAPLPIVAATGRPAMPFLGAEAILMSSRARDKDAAFAVMDALTGDAAAIVRAKARQVVANPHAYDDPAVAADPVLHAFRTQAEQSVPMSNEPAMRVVWTPYRTAIDDVISGHADARARLESLQDQVRGYAERR
ncbi:MAG TPA: extracellular solute-binding protein [Kofleriaceae bacterium]